MKPMLILVIATLMQSMGPMAKGAAFDSTNAFLVRSQASNSLAVFQALITPANYNLLGFHSSNDVNQATNGEALLIYKIELHRLSNYLPGQDFNPLLEPDARNDPPHQVIVPVMVGTNVRSSTTLRLEQIAQGQQWTNANWGQPKRIRELIATQRTIQNFQLSPGTVPFAVEIPVFDLWLLGYYDTQNRLVLLATVDIRLGALVINRHQAVSQAAMFRLAIAAQRYNGLPN